MQSMSSEVAVSHHPQQQEEQQRNQSQQSQQVDQHRANPGLSNTMATATSNSHTGQGISSAVTTATAAQAAAAAAAAGRDMKNFSDLEINELLGLIPDEYTAEEQAAEAAAAAATAAANAASALGRGVHHSVSVVATGVPSSSKASRSFGNRRMSSVSSEVQQQHGGSTDGNGCADQKPQDAHIAAQEAQLRSERKRSREKQRRNDVNKQFAELTEVLKNIEREAQEVGRNDDAYGSVSTMMAIAASTGPTNRVDLIARTIVHLERLNRTAKKQRLDIASLREQLERTKKAGEDMAEKLKDVMFNQQRQFSTAAYAPFPQLTSSSVPATATSPATAAPGMSHMAAPSGVPQQPIQQQIPMMMMPMMIPQSTAQAPGPAGAPAGTPAPTGAPGAASLQQQQPQQQFMMVMHPGGQMTMAGQPMQQMMQPMAPVQQQPQPATQQPQHVQQVHQQQHQTYVQHQQQPMQHQQQQPIAPATQAPAGQGSSNGSGGSSNGENFAHAA